MTFPVLAERFRAAGYATAGFVANLHFTAYDSGLDRGFVRYDDYEINWRQILASSSYAQTNSFDPRIHGSWRETVDAVVHPDLSILPGVSLARAWRDTSVSLSAALGEVRQQPNPLGDYPTAKSGLKSLASESWFYIRHERTGVEELYEYSADPTEAIDYAKSDTARALLRPWRERLARVLAERN